MSTYVTEDKDWYKSKTFWLNVLAIAIGLMEGFQGQAESGVPLTVMGTLGIVLRVLTKRGVKF